MRGSLDKAKNKVAQRNLEKVQTKKAREDLNSSHGHAPSNHGNQQGDTSMEGIFIPNKPRNSFDKATRIKLKPIRGSLNTNVSQAKLTVSVQECHTNMDALTSPNMLSIDKAKSNSTKGESERLKMKPLRKRVEKSDSQAKPMENGKKRNKSMDDMALPDMLSFLEKEEALLLQMQNKMSAELSRLQVEEHVFLHTLKILGQKQASINKIDEDQQPETSSGDQDLIDALNEALMENGEYVLANNENKGEETSE